MVDNKEIALSNTAWGTVVLEALEPALKTRALAVETAAEAVMSRYPIIRFRGKAMIRERKPYGNFVLLDKETFQQLAYPLVGGVRRSLINDAYAFACSTAKDLTDNDHLIVFGAGTDHPTVWDMEKLEIRHDVLPDDCLWHSPYSIKKPDAASKTPVPFLLSLVGGDMTLYEDTVQSLAPLIMKRKPDGIIWWVGDGTDDRMSIINILQRVFPGQLTSITVKHMIGGRSNTLSLNRALGNVAEDGNNQISDIEIYKNIGSHQNFQVHKYHHQSGVEVRGNIHHIFSSDGPPIFATKSLSVTRRTHIIEFGDHPRSQLTSPSDEAIGQLLVEMCRHAIKIKKHGFNYQWSMVGAAESEARW